MTASLSTQEEQYPKGLTLVIIVVTVILASMLELLDTTIVNVALREISGSIGATTKEITWVVTAYAISNVIIIPLSGMLSNLFGRIGKRSRRKPNLEEYSWESGPKQTSEK